MLTVQEAFEQLLADHVMTNIETLRRWLRAGKIPGASIQSKKEGWRIPQESITNIIQEKKEANNQTDYKKGYQEGYEKAVNIYRKKTKELILKGIYEKEITIYRTEFRNLVTPNISTDSQQDFLLFSDDFLFQFGVRRPRISLVCTYLDDWVYFPTEDILFDLANQDRKDESLDDIILATLMTYLTQEFKNR
ncbi:helix-turn-helix domain-containing protein [Vagococcus jeotgali]|uniref:helix-turn-helix domain-containing protein n=1 Tax=Vagococcus jeotgali TaxID=3109030 RepID=UPI002DD93D14|nr:helix-turn-helix domain-containing protein [Vagococcus sp. B2T-5]